MDSLPPYSHEGNAPFITIPLTQGFKTIVDLEDADLAQLKWQINKGRYAMRHPRIPGSRTERLVVLMHRVILERHLGRPIQEGMVVDHINGDGLDNRRDNLREATQLQNMHNLQMHHDNTAQYKGVRLITTYTWEARLDERTVGYYDTAEDASFAYDKAALEEYGEFAHLNHHIDQVLA